MTTKTVKNMIPVIIRADRKNGALYAICPTLIEMSGAYGHYLSVLTHSETAYFGRLPLGERVNWIYQAYDYRNIHPDHITMIESSHEWILKFTKPVDYADPQVIAFYKAVDSTFEPHAEPRVMRKNIRSWMGRKRQRRFEALRHSRYELTKWRGDPGIKADTLPEFLTALQAYWKSQEAESNGDSFADEFWNGDYYVHIWTPDGFHEVSPGDFIACSMAYAHLWGEYALIDQLRRHWMREGPLWKPENEDSEIVETIASLEQG